MADIGMKDEAVSQKPAQSIETDQAPKHETTTVDTAGEGVDAGDVDAGDASDHDNTGDIDEGPTADGKVSNTLYKAFRAITEVLLNFKIKTRGIEEHYPSGLFKRLPNKRLLPEYYDIIKEPSAISTLRGKIQRKQYSGVPEFVRDFALVVHNAQIFNRPNSQPVRDVLKLDELFKEELQKLVVSGLATVDEIKYPDLGEIPYATPEPDPVSEDEEPEEEVEEEDEEEEEVDESDDDKKRKRGGRRGKNATGKKADEEEDDEDKAGDADQKRRGRPPKVATPMEHRIDRILKSLKKLKSKEGMPLIAPFERLPDKAEHPEYYNVILQPIAYDMLKKKAKRKKYGSIEELMKDIELMFNNAKAFNEDGSDIYNFATELMEEARRSEIEERARPDEDFLAAADGRIPLPYIVHKGDTWRVGDWIHIQNPNDVTKPIVAQIYRTWKTANGEEWINACWYYRPEQTVHQHEKHFFPNEVVKTGQYRDHKIDEVVDRCFVMFYTRYSRGRPRDLPYNTEVYVCEARYNEDKHKFNKIKTWASCLPDEVRDKDYEMDLFDQPRKIKKIPSPLLDRLNDNMKETDELPKPEFKHAGAPPVIGGIHRRPRDENQSPPPEATPPPLPAPPPAMRTSSISMSNNIPHATPSLDRQHSSNLGLPNSMARPSQSVTPQQSMSQMLPAANTAPYNRQPSFSAQQQNVPTANPQPQPSQPMMPYQQQIRQSGMGAAHPGSYTGATPNYSRSMMPSMQVPQYQAYPSANASTQRGAEAYVLSDVANDAIPKDIRDQFPCDDHGRVLFFTRPPLSVQRPVTGTATTEQIHPLQHRQAYLERSSTQKRTSPQLDEEMQDAASATDGASNPSTPKRARVTLGASGMSVDPQLTQHKFLANCAHSQLSKQIQRGMENDYKTWYGAKDWKSMLDHDLARAEERNIEARNQDKLAEMKRLSFNSAHLGDKNGTAYPLNKNGYIMGWQKNFFTGEYLDDYDNRLPL